MEHTSFVCNLTFSTVSCFFFLMPQRCLLSSTQRHTYAACLISTPGDAASCGFVTMGCLCGPVAVWGRRVAAARHRAELLSQPQSCFCAVWKAARFSGRFWPWGMSFTKWMALFSGQFGWSQSVMAQDEWAHIIAFHYKRTVFSWPFCIASGLGFEWS